MVISIITCPAGWALGHGHQFHHPLPSLSAVVAGRERAATLVSWGARVVSGLDSIWFLRKMHTYRIFLGSVLNETTSVCLLGSDTWHVIWLWIRLVYQKPNTTSSIAPIRLQLRTSLAFKKTKKLNERAKKKAASQKNAFYKLHTFCFTVSVAASGKQHHPPPHVWANPTQTPPHCRDPRGSRRHGCHATKT